MFFAGKPKFCCSCRVHWFFLVFVSRNVLRKMKRMIPKHVENYCRGTNFKTQSKVMRDSFTTRRWFAEWLTILGHDSRVIMTINFLFLVCWNRLASSLSQRAPTRQWKSFGKRKLTKNMNRQIFITIKIVSQKNFYRPTSDNPHQVIGENKKATNIYFYSFRSDRKKFEKKTKNFTSSLLTNCVISIWSFTELFRCTHRFRFLCFESFLTRNSSNGFTRSSSFMQLAHGSLSRSLNFFNENKNLEMRIFLLFSFSRKWKLAQHLSCDLHSTVPRTH